MVKVSQIISKYVISLFNGKIEGVVENVLIDNATNKVKFLVVFNEETLLTQLLATDKIFAIGNDAVSVKNSGALTLFENKEKETANLFNPINSAVFTIEGEARGRVTDVQLNEKYYVEKFETTDGLHAVKNIANYTGETLILKDTKKNVNIKNFYERKKANPVNDTRIVSILSKQTVSNPSDDPTQPLLPQTMLTPNRAITNYAFLINRKVQKNIVSQAGNLIIKENSRINTNIINIARKNGKLKELTKYSI